MSHSWSRGALTNDPPDGIHRARRRYRCHRDDRDGGDRNRVSVALNDPRVRPERRWGSSPTPAHHPSSLPDPAEPVSSAFTGRRGGSASGNPDCVTRMASCPHTDARLVGTRMEPAGASEARRGDVVHVLAPLPRGYVRTDSPIACDGQVVRRHGDLVGRSSSSRPTASDSTQSTSREKPTNRALLDPTLVVTVTRFNL